jgi:peptidoglycan/xylan/chitin deacetylase (PgdA/CDA1 family)
MKNPSKLLIIAVLAVTMLASGVFSTNNLAKASPTSGVVTIVFDDGKSSQFSNAFPLMQEHGFVGTYYIITDNVGTAEYMNISNLQALQNAGNEIASHSVDHPVFTDLTDEEISNDCNQSQQFLQDNGFPATNFAYPYGYSNSHTDSIILQYYRSARHSYGDGYIMPIPPTTLQMSIPMGFAGETGDSNALGQDETVVQWAHDTNSWVIIFFHDILTTTLTSPWQIEQSNFAAFLNYVANSGVQVLTVNQALSLWSPPHRATVLPSSVAMDVGQSQTFTTSFFNITSPYNYNWYLNGDAVGTNISSYTFNALSLGLFSLYVNVTDSAGITKTVMSNSAPITVNPALVAPVAGVSFGVIDQGQSCRITSSIVTTGTAPYGYQWLQRPPGSSSYSEINEADSDSYSFDTSSSTAAGKWRFILQVTDDTGATVNSNTVSVTVNTAPVVSVSPSLGILDVGQCETFLATPTGGSGSYTSFQWYVNGLAQSGATASTYSYSPGLAGSFSITGTVTDSLGVTSVQSSAAFVHVAALPNVSIAPVGSVTLDVGQAQVFKATSSGGSGVIHYQWFIGGSVVSGATGSTYSFSSSVGSYSVTCKVTDSASIPVTSGASEATTVTVNPPLVTPALSASKISVDQGQTSSLTSSPTINGTSPYTYQWFERTPDGSYVAVGLNSADFSFVTSGATSIGSWSFILQVKDNVGALVNSSAVAVMVNSALASPVVSADLSSIVRGQNSTLSSSALITGTYPYSYQWYMKTFDGAYVPVGVNSPSFNFVTSNSTVLGYWSFILQVSDANGATVNSSVVSVTVNPTISVSIGFGGVINPSEIMTVNYSDNQTFKITANSGYYIIDVLVDGNPVGAINSYTFTNVKTIHTISAIFAPISTPTPTTSPTVSPSSKPLSTVTPIPTETPTPTQAPTTSPKPTQSNSLSEINHIIASAITTVAIIGTILVVRQKKA